MANMINPNVYKINAQDAIPLGNVKPWGFPVAGIVTRGITDHYGNPYIYLSTGVYCYGQIIWPTGSITALVVETQAALAALAG